MEKNILNEIVKQFLFEIIYIYKIAIKKYGLNLLVEKN